MIFLQNCFCLTSQKYFTLSLHKKKKINKNSWSFRSVSQMDNKGIFKDYPSKKLSGEKIKCLKLSDYLVDYLQHVKSAIID